jgi:hypothetical protein
MFNKSSNHMNKINKKLTNIRNVKLLGDPNFTKIAVMSLGILLVIYLMLPCHIQIMFQTLLQHPVILSCILVFCLLIGYLNTTVAFSLVFFIAVLYFNHSVPGVNLGLGCIDNSNNKEGFKSKSSVDVESDEEVINNKIKDLFASPGPFVKSFNESKEALKDIKKKQRAEEAMLDLETKTEKRKARKERFSNTSSGSGSSGSGREDFKPIPQRKFNPAEKEDTDLLMVMEHCKDISNRIKYEYEDSRYLKKYIKDKLGDIIEVLDLVDDDE